MTVRFSPMAALSITMMLAFVTSTAIATDEPTMIPDELTDEPTVSPVVVDDGELPPYTVVNYTDEFDGTKLMGYISEPYDASETNKRPAVVILPDWDGVNEYEQARASLFASTDFGGYVSIAADMYGIDPDNHQPETYPERLALSSLYRNNIALMSSRVESAINVLKGMPTVDASKIALVGYCFGGGIALNYALAGHDSAIGAIAFHGSLSAVNIGLNNTIVPKVLILSGGEDSQDSTKSVIDMEGALNDGNATWELTRYSGVEHAFTNFGSMAYNPYVDERSHDSAKRFLAEIFGEVELVPDLPDEIAVSEVMYQDADSYDLTGFVSYPSSDFEGQGPYPAVIIIHDSSGTEDYEKTRAEMISDMGFVGFATDIFGTDDGNNLTNQTELFVQRIGVAIDTVKGLENVDVNNIALLGYSLGGTAVLDYAFAGESEAKGVVSFHGVLSSVVPVSGKSIHAKILIESGGEDDEASTIEDLEEAMEAGNATWEYSRYSGVEHAFTVWSDESGTYSQRADVRSWDGMVTWLTALFDPANDVPTAPTTPVPAGPTMAPETTPQPTSQPTPPTSAGTSHASIIYTSLAAVATVVSLML